MATGSVKSTEVQTIATLYSGVRAFKTGYVVELSFEGFSAQNNYSANETLFTLPSEFIPKFAISFIDTLNSGRRIAIDYTTGNVYCTTALTQGTVIRGGVTYIV